MCLFTCAGVKWESRGFQAYYLEMRRRGKAGVDLLRGSAILVLRAHVLEPLRIHRDLASQPHQPIPFAAGVLSDTGTVPSHQLLQGREVEHTDLFRQHTTLEVVRLDGEDVV